MKALKWLFAIMLVATGYGIIWTAHNLIRVLAGLLLWVLAWWVYNNVIKEGNP
jgi:hypothetical protein